MSTISLTLQDVNGDPFTAGGNINITTGTTTGAVFNEPSGLVSLSTVATNDSVTINGFTYTYDYLGAGDVRGDAAQPAAFIRIVSAPGGAPIPVGTTFAIDLTGQPGDPDYPNLQNGNTKLAVSDLDTTGNVWFPGVPCFSAGTEIATATGPRPVEAIAPGDLVMTRDHGLRPVRWAGQVTVPAEGALAPVVLTGGVVGNRRDLVVSPQHRVLLTGWQAQLYCGEDEILVAAIHLVNGATVRQRRGGTVTYVHLLFDGHEVIESEGAWTESLYLGSRSLGTLPAAALAELRALFPGLAGRLDRGAAHDRPAPRRG